MAHTPSSALDRLPHDVRDIDLAIADFILAISEVRTADEAHALCTEIRRIGALFDRLSDIAGLKHNLLTSERN